MVFTRRSLKIVVIVSAVMLLVTSGVYLTASATAQWVQVGPGSYRVLHPRSDGKSAYLVSVWSPYTQAAQVPASPNRGQFLKLGSTTLLPVPKKGETPVRPANFKPEAVLLEAPSLFQGRPSVPATWESRSIMLGQEQVSFNLLQTEGRSYMVSESPNTFLSLSPDGTKLAAIDSRLNGLWLHDLSSGTTQLLTAPRPDGFTGYLLAGPEPVWAQDGKSIYFHSTRTSPRNPSLWKVSVEGGTEQIVVDANSYGPVKLLGITFDGKFLLQGSNTIYAADQAGSVSVLIDQAIGLSLGPDGSKFLYSKVDSTGSVAGIVVLDLASGTSDAIAWPTGYLPEGRPPEWSPSGQKIATFLVNPQNADDRLLVGVDFSTPKPMVTTFSVPGQGLSFNLQVTPSWVGESYLLVGTIKAGVGNELAQGRPSTWLLRLQ